MCTLSTGWVTYVVASLGLPQANVLRREANNVACLVDDTGASTTSADVDSNIVILLHDNVVSHVDGILSHGRSHPAKWNLCHGDSGAVRRRNKKQWMQETRRRVTNDNDRKISKGEKKSSDEQFHC